MTLFALSFHPAKGGGLRCGHNCGTILPYPNGV